MGVWIFPSDRFTSVKTNMFYSGLSIAPLHFYLEKSKIKVNDAKIAIMSKSFFGHNSTANDLIYIKYGIFEGREKLKF